MLLFIREKNLEERNINYDIRNKIRSQISNCASVYSNSLRGKALLEEIERRLNTINDAGGFEIYTATFHRDSNKLITTNAPFGYVYIEVDTKTWITRDVILAPAHTRKFKHKEILRCPFYSYFKNDEEKNKAKLYLKCADSIDNRDQYDMLFELSNL